MTEDREECPDGVSDGTPARTGRVFLGRAVRFLAEEEGLSQFLAIGAGNGSGGGARDVVLEAGARSRIVYASSDPGALAQARSLLAGRAPGTTDCLEADLRDPGRVLARAADTLDFGRAIGVLLPAIGDSGDPARIVALLVNALTGGSYLALTHGSEAEAGRLLDGLSLAEPGLVPVQDWRPDPDGPADADTTPLWAGVARLP